MCVNDVDSSEETGNDSSDEDEMNSFMLMAVYYFGNEYTWSGLNEEEAMVDMEGDLISSLEEIDRLRLKKRKHKQLLLSKEGKRRCEALEEEVVKTGKELKTFQTLYH